MAAPTANACSVASGCSNLFIPGAGFVYAAPGLIAHYIDAHQYQPPPDFCAAVPSCPPMGTAPYFEALRRNASGDFRRYIEGCLADPDYIEWCLADPDVWYESERQRLGMDRPKHRSPLGGLVARLFRAVMGKAKAVRP